MRYPTYVKNCIEMLEQSGYRAYAVGGAVRDCLLGNVPSDWDVTTSARPEEILSVFANYRTIPTGIKHGTVTVLFESEEKSGEKAPIEITTFRIDGEYRDARHPENVEFSNELEGDLSRRDFTVNALAFNEKEGIIDVFDGQSDLKNRTIRAVGDPQKRFSEDALRILRAFRFSAQLGFEIEEKTLLATTSCAPLLKNIARERVGAEFKKLISCKGVDYSLQKMVDSGVWQSIFAIPCPDRETISKLAQTENGSFAPRLSLVVCNCSDGEKDEMLNFLRLSNKEKSTVLRLCSVQKFEIPQSNDKFPAAARHFLHLYNNIYDEARQVLRVANRNGSREFEEALEFERNKEIPLEISSLKIKGSDLLPLCKSDHSRVGKTLELLLDKVLENPCLNEKEILLEIAKKELE